MRLISHLLDVEKLYRMTSVCNRRKTHLQDWAVPSGHSASAHSGPKIGRWVNSQRRDTEERGPVYRVKEPVWETAYLTQFLWLQSVGPGGAV